MLIYTDLASEIIADIAAKVPGMGHLDPDRIGVAAAARWAGTKWGNLATCIGLQPDREPGFSIWTRGRRSKRAIEVSPWFVHRPVEIDFGAGACRYLVLLRLPRMLEHDPLETLAHELWHIGEGFDGKLRTMRHGKMFDWNVKRVMRLWLERADPRLAALARMTFEELEAKHGPIVARRLPGRFRSMFVEPAEAPLPYAEAMDVHYPGHRLAPDFKIAPIKFTAPRAPRRITERECKMRTYLREGSHDLSAAHLRYLGRARPAEAG